MSERPPPDEPLATRTEAEGATVDLPEGTGFFHVGQVLGDRYEILAMLGRGGMGEVWRAFDLKLRVEVGLKALRDDLFQSERRLELLRQEVRAAREVVSPNVCRIFDLIEIDGRELVSMEYVDGATLLGVLQERGPLELKEAQDIASQFLSGLEAIHKAGLVHRDVKPENIMLTRAGRVVVMDFGLARGPESGAGSVSGTPAYMAPEHAAGGDVDARADVYSAGVVLAEMVSPEGIKSYQSRQSLWEDVRSEPARIPESPWAPVIKRAVARDRERRQNSAHTLIRELEDVTLRVEGAEDLHPYPGLASFTESDAEYFFGREAEVEAIWRRLESAHLLAIVGASGAGKSSFIAAGLTPHSPPAWQIARCTPGNAAVSSLRRTLIRELTGDAEALEALVDSDSLDSIVEAAGRWRRRHGEALLIVDQFEELFTLNPADEQARFATLIGQLTVEADVRVLLSMRDDFLLHCNRHEGLRPLFATLTPLDSPTGAALRRAVTQPALTCGYRFEDDELVEEILAEVEGERGALPMLAFAASRLWEKRDRETGLLTRQAYHNIGGVGGALARHAEATVDRIGVERIPIVRELFRNLVTAEGTRAVREWDELLSVFERSALPSVASKTLGVRRPIPHSERSERSLSNSEHSERSLLTSTSERSLSNSSPARAAAADVLRELIDARLLTSYEIHEDEHEPIRRVEIIHESLLANWPRLVRWQTQDQEGAQLRDELRQAARAWDEHGRHDDRLWTGTAYREFQLWRERYPGGLTELEEVFAAAMTSLATHRKRRRRAAYTVAALIVIAVAATFANLWRRSLAETRRAEASELVALGQLELDSYPSATVAHAIASLEEADSQAARRLALEALWQGPTALVASEDAAWSLALSEDGSSLVKSRNLLADSERSNLTVYRADGSRMPLKDVHDKSLTIGLTTISSSGHFASFSGTTASDTSDRIVLWSVNRDEPLAQMDSPTGRYWRSAVDENRRRLVVLLREDRKIALHVLGFDGTTRRLGTLEFETERTDSGGWTSVARLEQGANRLGVLSRGEVYVVDVLDNGLGPARKIGHHDNAVSNISCDPSGRFVVTAGVDGGVRFWDQAGLKPPVVDRDALKAVAFAFTFDGSFFTAAGNEDDNWIVRIWDLRGDRPRFHQEVNIGGAAWGFFTLDQNGRHISRSGPDTNFRLFRLAGPAAADPLVLRRGDNQQSNEHGFNPDGKWLATTDLTGLVFWPLARGYPHVIRQHAGRVNDVVFDPGGRWIATSSDDETVRIWTLAPEETSIGPVLHAADALTLGLAASPDGTQVMAGTNSGQTVLISLDGSKPTVLEGFRGQTWGVAFSHDGRLVAAAGGLFDPAERSIRVWDRVTGDLVSVLDFTESPYVESLQFISNRYLLSSNESALVRWDLDSEKRSILYEGVIPNFVSSADGRRILMVETDSASQMSGKLTVLDTSNGDTTVLGEYGDEVFAVDWDSDTDVVVTGDLDGEIRVGTTQGDGPHLMVGHEGKIAAVKLDPLGRWIASAGTDTTLRLWPMPDLTKPPLHTLPREELIAKLKTLTNLRVVRDPESATGWKLTHDPFPGWETVPTW